MVFAQRRPFLWLLVLILFHLLILSVQIRNPEGQVALRSWAIASFSPIASASRFVTSGSKDILESYVLLRETHEQNAQLLLENQRLRIEVSQLQALASLVKRTSSFELFQQQYRFETVLSSVIGKSAPFYSSRLVVNKGLRDEVDTDSAVIIPEGIVGRVLGAGAFSAEVELITNQEAGAGALLQGSRLQGVVLGDGSTLLRLEYIPNFEEVEPGEQVFTSGTDRIYPKGLPIGVVTRSQKGPMIYREIWVKPFVDFSRLEEVLIVRLQNSGDAPGTDASQPLESPPPPSPIGKQEEPF